jgi:hypothetical protein
MTRVALSVIINMKAVLQDGESRIYPLRDRSTNLLVTARGGYTSISDFVRPLLAQ